MWNQRKGGRAEPKPVRVENSQPKLNKLISDAGAENDEEECDDDNDGNEDDNDTSWKCQIKKNCDIRHLF